MRDQAMQIQRQLAAEEITVEKKGITIIITGDQKSKKFRPTESLTTISLKQSTKQSKITGNRC